MKRVELSRQPVELYKILKFEGLVESGGAAKQAISEGRVRVNGAVETQKRKQIVSGDRIEFEGTVLEVHYTAPE
jgi:ribosome-associated protein